MIHESEPWRRLLLTDMRGLEKRAKTRRITEHRSIFLERAVFFAAYAMRKLDDAKKLSTSWRGTALKCTRFPHIGRRPPDLMNSHHIERHYNLAKPERVTMGARDFCDLVIHSFIFLELLNDDRSIGGFFITSDKLKSKGIWQFDLDMVIGLVKQTADDSPAAVTMHRDLDTGEMKVVWAGNDPRRSPGWPKN